MEKAKKMSSSGSKGKAKVTSSFSNRSKRKAHDLSASSTESLAKDSFSTGSNGKDSFSSKETPPEMIRWAFLNPDSPACFTSSHRVWQIVKKRFRKTTIHDVEDVLQRIPTYTLHKARKIHFKRLKTIAAGFMSDVQVDLADFQKISDQNNGFNYILVGADVLSRRIFAAPVKSKASGHMKTAFRKLFKQMPVIPRRIFSDQGKEFIAGDVKEMLDKVYKIDQNVAQEPAVKAAVAERFVRTLKSRLYRYFTQNSTKRWVEVLPKLVVAINNTKSRATGMKPIDVDFYNAQDLRSRIYGQNTIAPGRSKIEEGDTVRVGKMRTAFTKSYLPNYTDLTYKVDRKVPKAKRWFNEPDTFHLKSEEGKAVTGKFYASELSRTKPERNRSLRIEKVLKTRMKRGIKEYFVTFEGHPPEEAAWITAGDLL
jgi:hypothetical protein